MAVIELVIWLLMPTLVVCAALQAPRAFRAGARLARSRGLRPSRPVATATPIERVASDLRRLRAKLEHLRRADDQPYKAVRWKGARLAYEDRLVEACRALEVDESLLASCSRRAAGHYRPVEEALAAAGLDVRVGGPELTE